MKMIRSFCRVAALFSVILKWAITQEGIAMSSVRYAIIADMAYHSQGGKLTIAVSLTDKQQLTGDIYSVVLNLLGTRRTIPTLFNDILL